MKRIVIVSAAAGTLAGAAIGVVALGPAPASARATPAALTASGNPSGAPGRPGRGGPGGGPGRPDDNDADDATPSPGAS